MRPFDKLRVTMDVRHLKRWTLVTMTRQVERRTQGDKDGAVSTSVTLSLSKGDARQ
jgi:hypothetical protein